jgi:hypothetical protein
MKTWMFVTAVFWLFYKMCVCPQDLGQMTTACGTRGLPVTDADRFVQRWYCPSYVRPPPAGNPHQLIGMDAME